MNRFGYFMVLVILFFPLFSQSQTDSAKTKSGGIPGLPPELSIGGYIDAYISYDNDKDASPRKFSAIAPYRDEFRINLAMASLRYSAKNVRGNLALQFGDIPSIDWPQEPNEYLQYIQEANIGFRVTKHFWIDAGYFLTHIGTEGIIPRYNFFQTLSICTYFQPFYQSGIKFSYEGKKYYASFMVLNGYNTFMDFNKNKSVGVQLGCRPNDKLEFTYNNILGNEMPAGVGGKTRFYNDFIVKYNPVKRLETILCADFCWQEKSKISDSSLAATLYSGFISMRYHVTKKLSFAARAGIYADKDGILSGTFTDSNGSLTGLKAASYTIGAEYDPVGNAYCRLESRYLVANSSQQIFNNQKSNRVEVILSGGLEFP